MKHIKKMKRKRLKHIIREAKVKQLRANTSCLVRESEVKKVLLANKPLYLLYCKSNILIANNSNELIAHASVEFLLQEYKDVFSKKSQMDYHR